MRQNRARARSSDVKSPKRAPASKVRGPAKRGAGRTPARADDADPGETGADDGERDRDQAPFEEKGPHEPLPQGRRPREGRKGPSR